MGVLKFLQGEIHIFLDWNYFWKIHKTNFEFFCTISIVFPSNYWNDLLRFADCVSLIFLPRFVDFFVKSCKMFTISW